MYLAEGVELVVASAPLIEVSVTANGVNGRQGPAGPLARIGDITVTALAPGSAPAVTASGTGEVDDPINLAFALASGRDGESGVNPRDVGYDVVVMVGQSNGAGAGPRADLTDPVDPRVFAFPFSGLNVNSIVVARDPMGFQPPDASPGVSPATEFGRQWVRRQPVNRRVLIVPCNVGGSGLTNGQWAAPSGAYLAGAIAHTNRALAAAGPNSRVVAFVWQQGEFDSSAGVTRTNYASAVDATLNALRAGVAGAADAPIVIAGMVPEWRTRPSGEVGTALQVNAALADTPNRLPNAFYVEGVRGQCRDSQGIHFEAAGARAVGRHAVEAITTGQRPLTVPVVTSVSAAQTGSAVTVRWVCDTWPIADSWTVEYRQGTGAWTAGPNVAGAATSCVLTLAAGTWEVRLTGTNSVGVGGVSPTATVTVQGVSPAVEVDPRRMTVADGTAVSAIASTGSTASISATQGVVSARPMFRIAALNGAPCLQFDGADHLSTGNLTVAQIADGTGYFTVIAVAQLLDLSVDGGLAGIRDTDDNSPALYSVGWSKSAQDWSGEAFAGSATSGYQAPHALGPPTVVLAFTRGATASLSINNGSPVTSANLAGFTGTLNWPLVLGAVGKGATAAASPLVGRLGYLAIYKGALSASERQAAVSALMAAFGI